MKAKACILIRVISEVYIGLCHKDVLKMKNPRDLMHFVCTYTSSYFSFMMMSTDAYTMMMIIIKPCMTLTGLHDKPSLHPGVRDRATCQPLGQDRRGILEVARKVRALKLSCSRKAKEEGDGARFASNQRREQAVRRVPHRQIEEHTLSVSDILPRR